MSPSHTECHGIHLHGKRGLVLGMANAQSIAWGCATRLHALGAEVVGTCLNEKARAHVQPLTDALGMTLITCDVSRDEDLQAAVAYCTDRWGRIDFVVHSIAWAPLQDLHGPVVRSSRQGFLQAMDISSHSFARLAGLCEPAMAQGGSLLAMSYLGAEEAVAHYGLMGPVKAALESLVRYMAQELGPRGIRVHAISPGPVPTRAASGIEAFDDLMAEAARKAPLGRLVTLEEIGALCAFLCSDAASGMTGQTIYVDGGCHAVA